MDCFAPPQQSTTGSRAADRSTRHVSRQWCCHSLSATRAGFGAAADFPVEVQTAFGNARRGWGRSPPARAPGRRVRKKSDHRIRVLNDAWLRRGRAARPARGEAGPFARRRQRHSDRDVASTTCAAAIGVAERAALHRTVRMGHAGRRTVRMGHAGRHGFQGTALDLTACIDMNLGNAIADAVVLDPHMMRRHQRRVGDVSRTRRGQPAFTHGEIEARTGLHP